MDYKRVYELMHEGLRELGINKRRFFSLVGRDGMPRWLRETMEMYLGLPPQEPGIYLVTGPMFAGKTTYLQRVIGIAEELSMRIAAFTHRLADSRDHNGNHHGFRPLDSLSELEEAELVVVDEIQFFDDEIAPLLLISRDHPVLVGGLLLDYLGKPFQTTSSIAAMANWVRVLSARCSVCGREAHFTGRIPPTGPIIDPDASYVPLCFSHFIQLTRTAQLGKISQ